MTDNDIRDAHGRLEQVRAIELFPCSGGLSEGFRRAGLDFLASFDRDPNACDSHERNIGTRPIQIDVRDLVSLTRAGLFGGTEAAGGSLDLIVADPPCVPWSRAGKRRGLDDERDMLTETVELVRLLRPRADLICNIPGLDDAPHLRVVQRTIGSLTKDGYCAADFASINAADFGVPQIRYRPFWYVHRTGSCLRWPERTHCDPDEIHPTLPGIEPLRPWVTCMEALDHLSEMELGRYVRLRKRNQNGLQHGSVRERPARTVGTSNLSDGNVLLTMPGPSTKGKRNPSTRGPQSGRVGDPSRPSAAIDTKVSRVGAGEAHVLRAWPWARPSTTVFTTDRILPPGHHPESGSIMSQGNAVVLSEKAGAILQGFPESWVFAGSSKRARWEQIGQAVPIAVAEAVARRVLIQLRSK